MFMIFIAAVFLAVYKVIYPVFTDNAIPVQSTSEPVEPSKSNPLKIVVPKPEVILGDPLTEKEWEWIQASSKTMN